METSTLEDALLRSGVFALSIPKRKQLATELAQDGISAADVEHLRDYLIECTDDFAKAQRVLASKLMSAEERKQVISDLRTHLQQRASLERRSKSSKTTDAGQAIRDQNMDRVRRFEADWSQYLQDKANGKLEPVEFLTMPWQRARQDANSLGHNDQNKNAT